ncbi:hypothetical protein LCGC14_2544470 [marine sediment metagenome]|uniref:Uncharacterized protein n=1 Tax=marine sediment metagenome TaxID=412755 RepID=A0A0F9AQ53_9ZZZZ
MAYAEVAVNAAAPIRQTFTYRIPDGLSLKVWHAVYVHRHTGAPFRLDPVDVRIAAQAAAQPSRRRYRVG